MDFDAGCGNALLILIECRQLKYSMTKRIRSDTQFCATMTKKSRNLLTAWLYNSLLAGKFVMAKSDE
jgi:hypothetical protein